jgi:hypothetical protein
MAEQLHPITRVLIKRYIQTKIVKVDTIKLWSDFSYLVSDALYIPRGIIQFSTEDGENIEEYEHVEFEHKLNIFEFKIPKTHIYFYNDEYEKNIGYDVNVTQNKDNLIVDITKIAKVIPTKEIRYVADIISIIYSKMFDFRVRSIYIDRERTKELAFFSKILDGNRTYYYTIDGGIGDVYLER